MICCWIHKTDETCLFFGTSKASIYSFIHSKKQVQKFHFHHSLIWTTNTPASCRNRKYFAFLYQNDGGASCVDVALPRLNSGGSIKTKTVQNCPPGSAHFYIHRQPQTVKHQIRFPCDRRSWCSAFYLMTITAVCSQCSYHMNTRWW